VVKKIYYNTMKGGLAMIRKESGRRLPAIKHAGFLDGVFARRQLTCTGVTKKN
jgi:hypothetical protein